MDNPRIIGMEWGRLESKRPRVAGANARLGVHGDTIHLPLVRLTTEDGAMGFGACHTHPERLGALLGARLDTLFSPAEGVTDAGQALEYPLWDLAGQRTGQPVFKLAAAVVGISPPDTLRAPCYDTSLYFDDLHLTSTEEAADFIALEARDGYARGHRAFKLKVGRGARHLPLEEGTARDIAIVQAVRAAVGPNCPLLLDANNGYTLNLAKHVLGATADCGVFWLEEAFHEDPVLYRDLKEWLGARGLPTLIADGEGDASPHLLAWAREGLVDVIQYDIFGHGLTRWLHLGKQLDEWGVRSAPHHYGAHFGNYAACHLAAAIHGFTYVEWDEAAAPGLDASGYSIENGQVHVPDTPGFGLALDEPAFRRALEATGASLRL
ncbi:MAG: mandelate racemase [Armatimonadetes bacterium]|nr:mandelate racemase [Armatimonadota bacterium]